MYLQTPPPPDGSLWANSIARSGRPSARSGRSFPGSSSSGRRSHGCSRASRLSARRSTRCSPDGSPPHQRRQHRVRPMRQGARADRVSPRARPSLPALPPRASRSPSATRTAASRSPRLGAAASAETYAITEVSGACADQNAEVEEAVDPKLGYVYELWMDGTGSASHAPQGPVEGAAAGHGQAVPRHGAVDIGLVVEHADLCEHRHRPGRAHADAEVDAAQEADPVAELDAEALEPELLDHSGCPRPIVVRCPDARQPSLTTPAERSRRGSSWSTAMTAFDASAR